MSTIIINRSSVLLLTFMWQALQSITSYSHCKNIPVHLCLSWRAYQEKGNKHLQLLRGVQGADALQGLAAVWGKGMAGCSFLGLGLHQAVLPAGVTVCCNNSIPECKQRRVGSLNTNGLCCCVDSLRKISHIFSCSCTAIVYLWRLPAKL